MNPAQLNGVRPQYHAGSYFFHKSLGPKTHYVCFPEDMVPPQLSNRLAQTWIELGISNEVFFLNHFPFSFLMNTQQI